VPMVRIKAGGSGKAELSKKVGEHARALLAASEDRVLVVYGERAASIYYEGERTPRARAV